MWTCRCLSRREEVERLVLRASGQTTAKDKAQVVDHLLVVRHHESQVGIPKGVRERLNLRGDVDSEWSCSRLAAMGGESQLAGHR